MVAVLRARQPQPWVILRHARRFTARADHNNVNSPSPRIAVIGSGPAGFYTAQKLMRDVGGTKIDMYEQLPVPFGLVRSGVAPDHPEVKKCQDSFDEVAASRHYTFIGNINVGHDLPLSLLAKYYDAIVFAYGASQDRKIGLVGEERPHIYSARAFVGWYNGLPEYRNLNPDLTAGDTAVVVGQGNVALDVARVLLSPLDHLKGTDMTEYALEALSSSKIRHIHVVGRRGPLQAAFTIKEVRELMNLPDVNFTPIPSDLMPADLKQLPRPKRRMLELLQKGRAYSASASKSWSLDFLLAPKELNYSSTDPARLEGVTFTRTSLTNPTSVSSGVEATDETVTVPTATLFRSIGYKAEPIPGLAEIGADFDQGAGTLSHDGVGRLISLETWSRNGNDGDSSPPPRSRAQPGLYCSGWVKRGPTGVIASTMSDAFQTAEAIVADWKRATEWATQSLVQCEGWDGVKREAESQGLKLRPVHWDEWQRINAEELQRGESRGKPREKFGSVDEMLRAGERSDS
ncbi:hypothetical protein DV737_g1366, partial [Chaetothyriales sp. CBS 132003]